MKENNSHIDAKKSVADKLSVESSVPDASCPIPHAQMMDVSTPQDPTREVSPLMDSDHDFTTSIALEQEAMLESIHTHDDSDI